VEADGGLAEVLLLQWVEQQEEPGEHVLKIQL
jgi:hypothetical protein